MHFFIYFHILPAILTSQVLALDHRHMLARSSGYMEDNADLEIPERDWKGMFLDSRRGASIQEDGSVSGIDKKTESMYARKSLHSNAADSAWWPSEVDYSDMLKAFHDSNYRETKKPATFEELEERNANIHNPLLNLDHYPIPSKTYTFEELEEMNANHHNPYLN